MPFEKLPITEQVRFYLQWCKDNKKNHKLLDSLTEYLNEIKIIYGEQ